MHWNTRPSDAAATLQLSRAPLDRSGMNLIAVPGYLHFHAVRASFQPPSIFFAFLLLSYGHVWRARGSLTCRTMKQAPQDFYCPLDLGLLDPDHSKGRIGWRVEPAYGSSEDDACSLCLLRGNVC